MIIEIVHLGSKDLPKVRSWIKKNSPDSKLLLGVFSADKDVSFRKIDWEWYDVKDYLDYSGYFVLAIDIPDKDAVHFKLVWG